VRLTFRRIPVDWLGIMLSVVGLGLCLIPARRPLAATEPSGATARALTTAQPYLIRAMVVVILSATAWNVARDLGPSYYYQRGWEAFQKQNYATARRYFERAILLASDPNAAAEANFFRAASLLRAGNPAAALAGYQEVIDRFPDSVWVAESHYHVGLCLRQLGRLNEAKDRFGYVITTYPGNRWACFADEQLRELNGEPRREVPCV
jgi:TolA-binding protein